MSPSNTELREALESIDFDWPVQLSNSVLTIHFLPPHAIDKLLPVFQTREQQAYEKGYMDGAIGAIGEIKAEREAELAATIADNPNDMSIQFFNHGYRLGQQQLLTELLGELPEKTGVTKYHGIKSAQQQSRNNTIDQVTNVIKQKLALTEQSGKGKKGCVPGQQLKQLNRGQAHDSP